MDSKKANESDDGGGPPPPEIVPPDDENVSVADDGTGGGGEVSVVSPPKSGLFASQTRRPVPYLLLVPVALVVLTAVGWSRDEYVETRVGNIWIATDGDYWADKEYADDLSDDGEGTGRGGVSTFAALAVSRDDGNLFREERLKEINARMEKAESSTIEYKGKTYTYQDVCASNNAAGKPNTTYTFPCARLSAMDLFQESRWFFDETSKLTWYDDLVWGTLVKPRIKRFGAMKSLCVSPLVDDPDYPQENKTMPCDHRWQLRNDEEYATKNGYPSDYAVPMKLFSDLGNMEMNDPCRMCIEMGFEKMMIEGIPPKLPMGFVSLVQGIFQVMTGELYRLATANPPQPNSGNAMASLATVAPLASSLDREMVEEMYFYITTRQLYAQLGAETYKEKYEKFQNSSLGLLCNGTLGQTDPDLCKKEITEEEAGEALLRHADHAFSSSSTSGNPLPYWGNDGDGYLFTGTSPVSGSGLDLTGTLLSSSVYFDVANYRKFREGDVGAWNPLYVNGSAGYMDMWSPTDPFQGYVATDPMYKWFMAGTMVMESKCGNDYLKGMPPGTPYYNSTTAGMAAVTEKWCTDYDVPHTNPENRTVQHFAKMWYDLLIDSDQFLKLSQGESDPYTWNTGQGCDYDLAGSRYAYTGESASDILSNASRELYYIDEGESAGAIDRNIMIGGSDPPVGEYDYDTPLRTVKSVQSVYFSLVPEKIIERVQHCNRPGGPITGLTKEDGEEILYEFKKQFEENWAAGWDDPEDGDVQFVGFYDDVGTIGTTGRMLEEMTMSSGTLMAISIVIIALFSILFLASFDVIESRVLLTLVGVALVLLAFFGALGLAILVGIKINVTIGWTLPFIMIGLGVDDLYIITLALKERGGFDPEDFVGTMKDVVVPVTMTSLVNAAMFAVMNISDIPAVYKTAQAALLSVCFLYITLIFCYPAFCWLDIKRQESNRYDVIFCKKKEGTNQQENVDVDSAAGEECGDMSIVKPSTATPPPSTRTGSTTGIVFDKFYKPTMLSEGKCRLFSHCFVVVASLALLGVSIWGITETTVGLGLEDFFPEDNQASRWAHLRTEQLASWSITMNWGALSYTNPQTQMKMIRQFEAVVATPHVSEVQTKQLWIADFNMWTSRHCTDNFFRDDPVVYECGMDMVYDEETNSTCKGTWTKNTMGLRLKTFVEFPCQPSELGVCRPTSQMHLFDLQELAQKGLYNPATDAEASWCPVFEGWSESKLKFCVEKWRFHTGGGGNLLVEDDTATENPNCTGDYYKDDSIVSPIPVSTGPTMFGIHLFSHDDTIDLIEDTRAICDEDKETHCWMSGIPYDYWEQYTYVVDILYELVGVSVAVGFGVASLFLFIKLKLEHEHSTRDIIAGSLAGGLLIALTCVWSVVTVVGLSSASGVNLTAFSDMSYVLSIGFAVEYSVHIIHRFITAPMHLSTAHSRVEYAMTMLFLPTFMSFVSSTIGVACLAFTEFEFNYTFFFKPLIIVMVTTYFYGCYALPVLLSKLNCGFLKLGHELPGFDEREGRLSTKEEAAFRNEGEEKQRRSSSETPPEAEEAIPVEVHDDPNASFEC